MYSTIKIECIGAAANPKHLAIDKMFGGILGLAEIYKRRWWVAEIVGFSDKYKFERKFVKQKKDFSTSNSVGSRGINANYMLEYGKLYEISSPVSWKKTDRYFVIGDDPDNRLSAEEADKWLKTKLV